MRKYRRSGVRYIRFVAAVMLSMSSELRMYHGDGIWYTGPGVKYVVCRSHTKGCTGG
jgi:hypothetical protein